MNHDGGGQKLDGRALAVTCKLYTKRHTRGSAQYVVDMMDHFGHVETKNGSQHFKLFDMDFGADGGDTRHRVIAQNDFSMPFTARCKISSKKV